MRNPDDIEGELNEFIQDFCFPKTDTATVCPTREYSKLWFPNPKTRNDFSSLIALTAKTLINI